MTWRFIQFTGHWPQWDLMVITPSGTKMRELNCAPRTLRNNPSRAALSILKGKYSAMPPDTIGPRDISLLILQSQWRFWCDCAWTKWLLVENNSIQNHLYRFYLLCPFPLYYPLYLYMNRYSGMHRAFLSLPCPLYLREVLLNHLVSWFHFSQVAGVCFWGSWLVNLMSPQRGLCYNLKYMISNAIPFDRDSL